MNTFREETGFRSRRRWAVRGLTLTELLIALVAGAIVLTGLARFLTFVSRDYSHVESIAELEQNAYHAYNALGGLLMETGAELPQLDTALQVYAADSVHAYDNPRGAYYAASEQTTVTFLALDDADPFHCESTYTAMHFNYDPTAPWWSEETIDTVDMADDTVHFSGTVDLGIGDILYRRREVKYYRRGSDNTIVADRGGESEVIAENVDSLRMTFFDKDGNQTTDWAVMKTCSLCVTVYSPHKLRNGERETRTRCKRLYFRNRTE